MSFYSRPAWLSVERDALTCEELAAIALGGNQQAITPGGRKRKNIQARNAAFLR